MSRRVGNKPWIAALLSLFLVFVLPACWLTVVTQSWLERSQGLARSGNTNEEREEHEGDDEAEVQRATKRPTPVPTTIEVVEPLSAPQATTHVVRLASVAPKVHPSRFSERRLR